MSVPLLYIGGSGRSGSTLLERMLACIPGYWPVGELVFIWERGLRRNDLCSCGDRFHDCAFWTEVGQRGFGGWDRVDVDEAVALRTRLDRHRTLDRLSGLREPGPLQPSLEAYARLTSSLYRAIEEVSGARVVVDSSKHLGYCLLLSRLAGGDVRLVHLVRRSHGVVHSWQRQVLKPGVGDGTSYMSVHRPAWAAGMWLADNMLYASARKRANDYVLVRYEDLIADHGRELARILTGLRLACPADGPPDTLTEPAVSHALSGNPMRLRQPTLAVRGDEAWQDSMGRRWRAVVSAMTWPLLWKYGYLSPLSRPAAGSRQATR